MTQLNSWEVETLRLISGQDTLGGEERFIMEDFFFLLLELFFKCPSNKFRVRALSWSTFQSSGKQRHGAFTPEEVLQEKLNDQARICKNIFLKMKAHAWRNY